MADGKEPRHYTREPWWVVPLAGIILGLLPVLKYSEFQRRNTTGLSLPVLMLGSGSLGVLAAVPLVVRSHIRSAFWSNVVLWIGVVIAATVASVVVLLLSA